MCKSRRLIKAAHIIIITCPLRIECSFRLSVALKAAITPRQPTFLIEKIFSGIESQKHREARL
jgi:hypothetical protein